MAKKAFIALLLLIAISGIAPPTHATATSVKGAEAATTPRKLVEKFQDQTVVEEVMIKLPQEVRVPEGGICIPPKYDQCDPDCLCIVPAIWAQGPGICVCPSAATHEEAPKKMVGNFQDETVVEEVMIKLPQQVRVPEGGICNPSKYDECDPGCFCIVPPFGKWPSAIGICACPPAATQEAPRKMVGNFQDDTVEKLIKLPYRN